MKRFEASAYGVEELSQNETMQVEGGWVGPFLRWLGQTIAGGLVYDGLKEIVMNSDGPQMTERDRQRIAQGCTHIGGRQPWI